MRKGKEFDEFIKCELYNEAGKIDPSEDILHKVQTEISKNQPVYTPTLKEKIFKKALPFQLNMKRCYTVALCTIFVATGLTFTFSKEARVAAADSINMLSKWIYVIDRTDEGYTPVRVQLEDPGTFDTDFEDTDMTDQELQKGAGFFIKIPSELSGDYKFYNKSRIYKKSDNSTVLVGAEYLKKNMLLSLVIQDKKFLEQIDDKELSKRLNKKVFKIGNYEAYWIEDYIKGIYPDHDLQQKPTGVKIYHSLMWEYKGSCYTLRGNENSEDLSLDDALKAAEGIINDKYPSADTIHKEKETDTYQTMEKSSIEIEKMLGFSAKLPNVLPGNFKLIQQKVENDNYTGDSKMWCGSYAEDSLSVYIRRVQLVITKSDFPLMEYDRIKENADDTRSFEKDGIKYLWRWNANSSHELAWNDNGVYYMIFMEKDDFTSMEEALTMAKAVIDYK
jgi:hypothetical protein